MECIEFLRSTQISSAIKRKDIITIDTETTLINILEVFQENAIISAPVYNRATSKVVAVLDMLDIIMFVIGFVGLEIKDNQKIIDMDPRRFATILENSGHLFSNSPASTILANRPNKLYTIKLNDNLLTATEFVTEYIPRLFIVDHQNTIINLISQTDILSIIAQNIHILRENRYKTLSQLGLGTTTIYPFHKDTRVIKILEFIAMNNQIEAVPIVDANSNQLIANFSISNLKGLTQDNFNELMLPILEYLQYQNIKEKNNNISCLNEKSFYPLTLFSWDTLESTIFKMTASRVKKLWVVNQNNQPISMVNIEQILKLLTMKPTNKSMALDH